MAAAARSTTCLPVIKDQVSKRDILIDTGAQVTLWPATPTELSQVPDDSISLVAANKTKIPAFGKRQMCFQFGSRKYTWTVIIAKVFHPLIGSDFLRHYKLLVDVANKQLLQMDSLTSHRFRAGQPTTADILHVSRAVSDPFTPILRAYPTLLPHDFHATESTTSSMGFSTSSKQRATQCTQK